jgi:hypothetical protein
VSYIIRNARVTISRLILYINHSKNHSDPITQHPKNLIGYKSYFEPIRLFGVIALDVVRAFTFAVHTIGNGANAKDFKVPVIGGHSGATILPIYSQAEPPMNLSDEVLAGVINREYFAPQPALIAGCLPVKYVYSSVGLKSLRASKVLVVPPHVGHTLVSDLPRLS